eukprot:GEMP01018579.1.p1 GENE.GEMP01018579.1~~GEMP01018579.1.p1  ORF type:complete len:396 (+),score=116.92 GEMP01018579.1:13-1200(+)
MTEDEASNEAARLFFANISRKRAEQDAMLLQNRIKLLLAEEAKALKKIEDTRTKIKEISDARQRVTSHKVTRQVDLETRDRTTTNLVSKNSQARTDTRKRIHQAKCKVEAKTQIQAHEIRVERERLLESITEARQQEHHFNHQLFEQAQKKKARVRSAREAQMSESKARAKALFEGKIEEENRLRHEKEHTIENMEREEVALIQRLQHTQQRQKAMYEQLADVVKKGKEPVATPRGRISKRSTYLDDVRVELYDREQNQDKDALTREIERRDQVPKNGYPSISTAQMTDYRSNSSATQVTHAALTDADTRDCSSQARDKPLSAKTTSSSTASTAKPQAKTAVTAGKNIVASEENCPPIIPVEKTYTTVDGKSFKIQSLVQAEELELASVLNGTFD